MPARRALAAAGSLALLLTGGCSAFGGADDPPPPRPEVLDAGGLVYAQGSVVHVEGRTLDVAPRSVTDVVWTPYGLYVGSLETGEEYAATWVFWGGSDVEPVTDIWGEASVPVSDGRYVAWIDRDGTDHDGEGQVIAIDARTGERVFDTRDDMGRAPYSDLYSELPPTVIDLVGGDLYWSGVESDHRTDLTTGETETVTASQLPPITAPGAEGYTDFASPDGRYEVHSRRVPGTVNAFTLRVTPRQPDFGFPVTTAGGWAGPHILVAAGERLSPRPASPGTKPGVVLSCELATGRCRQRARVVGVHSLVFPEHTYPRP